MPRALCQIYPDADVCAEFSASTSGAALAPVATAEETAPGAEVVASASAVVDPGATTRIPSTFEGAPVASVLVLTDSLSLTATIDGTALAATDVFGSPALGADLTAPADGVLELTNPGPQPAVAAVVVAVQMRQNEGRREKCKVGGLGRLLHPLTHVHGGDPMRKFLVPVVLLLMVGLSSLKCHGAPASSWGAG